MPAFSMTLWRQRRVGNENEWPVLLRHTDVEQNLAGKLISLSKKLDCCAIA
jgi:hypothetical protein